MPIRGLTTENTFGAGLPCIAKLYKGDEKPEDGRRPGKDLNYFRVEFEPQFESLLPTWTDLYGEEPTEFGHVFLAAATVDEAFQSWKEEWNASQTLLHRCDGDYQVMWWSDAAQMYSKAKMPCESPVDPKTGMASEPKCGCKSVGRLSLILPEFIQVSGILGYVSVSTHSLNDILTVYRYLSDIQRIYGQLTGVPFIFGRASREVSAPKQVKTGNGEYANKGRIKVTKSLFYLHVEAEFTQQRLLPALANVPALPAPTLPTEVRMVPVQPETTAEETETAKTRLGSKKRGSRRLGAEPTSAKSTGIFAENPGRALKFTLWCKGKLGMDEVPVTQALAMMQPGMQALSDWNGNEIDALAAVVAAAAGYDEERIEAITSSSANFKEEIGYDVYEAASTLAAKIREREEA